MYCFLCTGPPSVPQGLSAEVGDTWIRLTWEGSENLGRPLISHYSVLLTNTMYSQQEEMHSSSGLSTELTITGILPLNEYTTAVAAITILTNTNKTSNYSDSITVRTRPPLGTVDLQYSKC